MKSENKKNRPVIFWIMILSAIEAAGAIALLVRIPGDPKHSFLFGFSPARIFLLSVFIPIIAGCLYAAIIIRKRAALDMGDPYAGLQPRVQRIARVILLVAIFSSLLVLFFNGFQNGKWFQIVDRLEPLAGWVLIFSLQLLISVVFIQDKYRLRLKNPWLIGLVWAIFLVLFLNCLPKMIHLTNVVDLQTSHSIVQGVDDIEYVTPAINLIKGYGFVQSIILPLDVYHTAPVGFLTPRSPGQYAISHRPPGTSLQLALIYAIFGTETIYPRMAFIVLAWLTGLILLAVGTVLAGWMGAIAGGLAGLYYCCYSQAVDYALGLGVINSEIPSIFWLVFFGLVFVGFLKNTRNKKLLIISALSLSVFIMTRGNYFPSVFLLTAWMLVFLGKSCRKQSFIFLAITLLPSLLWSLYISGFQHATGYFHQPQGVSAFAMTNNPDVLEGVGPQHINRGDWPPQDGVYIANGLKPDYWPKEGENPTLKGLKFWWDYREELPVLFYRKLRVGSWYHNGEPRYPLGRVMNSLFIGGIGFLFASLGLRPVRRSPGLFPAWSGAKVAMFQAILILVLFLISNYLAFWLVLLIWAVIIVVALFHPYGDAVNLPFEHPSWMVAFIGTYLVSTMIFASDLQRYHAQLDPIILFYSLLGIGLAVQMVINRLSHSKRVIS